MSRLAGMLWLYRGPGIAGGNCESRIAIPRHSGRTRKGLAGNGAPILCYWSGIFMRCIGRLSVSAQSAVKNALANFRSCCRTGRMRSMDSNA